MASISSMISFFVLLLVTYSYAAPFLPEGTTTGEYEVINATVVIESDSTVVPITSIHIQSRSKSHFHNSTSSEESNSNENVYTTATDLNESSTVEDSSSIVMIPKRGVEESSDSTVTGLYESSTDVEDSSSIVMIPKRGIEVDSFTDANERRGVEESSDSTVTGLYESSTDVEDSSSIVMIPKRGMDGVFTDATETTEERDIEESTGMNDKRTVEDFLFTTIESSTEFNSRVIRPVQVVEEKIELSTIVSSERQPEMTTDVQPSSSVDSFVKFTGLLHDQPSTIFEYETTSQVEEESTTELPVTSETATKILSIIPGTISETKIVINRPTETPVVIQRVDQKQLSQVGNQSIIEETKSNN